MNRIQELRKERHMNQDDLADLLSVGRTAVSNYENEAREPSFGTIARLCEIFSCSADYLLGLSTQRTPEISDEDADLVAAYHAAPPEVRQGIDLILAQYSQKKENTAAG